MNKKKPTDATIRNVKAANKKLSDHEKRIKKLEEEIKSIKPQLKLLNKKWLES